MYHHLSLLSFIAPSFQTYLSSHQSSFTCNASLKEPENEYGRMTFWDESYRKALGQEDTKMFSWYSDWRDLKPFFSELVPLHKSRIMIPGIGNDGCIRDMFDDGYEHLSAFDYAPEGVECAKRIMGQRVQSMDDLRVADGRDLPYKNSSFDAVFDKGTLDSIYLSGGNDKDLSRKYLGMAVSELARTLKAGGIVFSVTAACTDAIQKSFEESNKKKEVIWEQLRDGSFFMTEDGYASNNVDATILVWRKL
jgi:SAM-dependent methyltransferase